MVKSCCVFKCFNKADLSVKENGVSFFRFPANKRKRLAWERAVQRKDWTPTAHTYICSKHFLDGWHSDDPDDNNFAPTIFPHKMSAPSELHLARQRRVAQREVLKSSVQSQEADMKRHAAHMEFSIGSHAAYCKPLDDQPTVPANIEPEDAYDDTDIHSVVHEVFCFQRPDA